MSDTPPTPPTGLRDRGREFWTTTVGAYELTEGEQALLREACRTIDNLDLLADQIATDGAMLTGSQGQPVIHPGLTEARGQRVVLHRLLAALNLPDPDGKTITTATSTRGTTAARARAAKRGPLKAL